VIDHSSQVSSQFIVKKGDINTSQDSPIDGEYDDANYYYIHCCIRKLQRFSFLFPMLAVQINLSDVATL